MQRVFETQFLGRPTIIKQRFSKQYRHPTLDAKLTTSRLKQVCKEHHVLLAVATASPQPASPSAACLLQEVRSILRARKIGVACPVVYYVEQEAATIYMEQIQGRSVKALISEGKITEAGGAMVPCACCIAAASWLNSCRSTGVQARRFSLGAYSQKQVGGSLQLPAHAATKLMQHTSSSEDQFKEAGKKANSSILGVAPDFLHPGMGCKHASRGRHSRPPLAGVPSCCALSWHGSLTTCQ